MSNNKQSIKLYTEEQLRKAFIAGMEFIPVDPLTYEQDADEYMDSLTPIQLPSDKEIEIKENANNELKKGTANTTDTTLLCTHFLSDGSFRVTLARCMKCGKTQSQHPIISNT